MAVKMLNGNYAAAYAAKLARVQVVAAYPITPQTSVIEKLSEFVERGELNARFIRVESEHSAMAAVLGAAAAGCRVYTATSAQGLLYMSEVVWWAAGARLPVVMGIVTRALAPPWSIWTDHTDFLSQRDSGWVMLFASSAQEVLDATIQAFRIAEDEGVLLPVAVAWDAFVVSHTLEPVSVPDQSSVDEFLPAKRPPPHVLDAENPLSIGNIAFPDSYMEFRWSMYRAMERAKRVVESAAREYGDVVGRYNGGLLDEYMCGDAEVVMFAVGAMAEEAKDAVDELRREGVKVGVCRIRCIRPFPWEEIGRICTRLKACAVVDRNFSMGGGGIISLEVEAALHRCGVHIPVYSYIAGLGGREVSVEDLKSIFLSSLKMADEGVKSRTIWYGVKKR